jgi:hypothetical protein
MTQLTNPDPQSTVEDVSPPLTSFDLSTESGRTDFLWSLSETGEEGLLPAVSHILKSLQAPQAMRSALIAKAAGIQAQGKHALFLFLLRFLDTFERECQPPPLPERNCFISNDAWNNAVLKYFAKGDETMSAVVSEFAGLLNSGNIP